MRIVYFIMAHKNSAQIIRLINRLDDEDVHFLIHIDAKSSDVYRVVGAALKDRANCHFLRPQPGSWGTFDLVRIALSFLKKLHTSGLEYDFAVLLSGQDYPLMSNTTIKQTFSQYTGKQLLRHAPLPIAAWPDGGWRRLRRYYFNFGDRLVVYPPFKIENPIEALVVKILSLFLRTERKLPHEYQAYGGEMWWAMSPACVAYVNAFVQTPVGQDLFRFFRFTRNPSELFFQTTVMNSPLRETAIDENLYYIDWSTRGRHPKILNKSDFDRLIASGQMFARKFDMAVDTDILDMLDERVMGSEA